LIYLANYRVTDNAEVLADLPLRPSRQLTEQVLPQTPMASG
jgi:hypothetical protein